MFIVHTFVNESIKHLWSNGGSRWTACLDAPGPPFCPLWSSGPFSSIYNFALSLIQILRTMSRIFYRNGIKFNCKKKNYWILYNWFLKGMCWSSGCGFASGRSPVRIMRINFLFARKKNVYSISVGFCLGSNHLQGLCL